jgi:hypothetical protein
MSIQKSASNIVMLGVLLALKLSQGEGDDELLRRLRAREPDAVACFFPNLPFTDICSRVEAL